ncbi:MAG TPA: FUSC family protein, partial [Acidimicrobiales bacterium]
MREFLRDLPILSVRRALRVTLCAAGTFAFLFQVAHNPNAAFFATFGSVVLLVYVEFLGPKRQRFEQHVGLFVITALFVVLGTLCSQILWLAVAATAVICFAVLMTGVVSSSFAAATTAMLISFLLPVAFQGPISSIPDRLLGWFIAGATSLLAVALILPAPASEPLVDVTALTLTRLADYLGSAAEIRGTAGTEGELPSEYADAASAAATLRTAFFTAQFRPVGISASARLLVKVIEWTLEVDLHLTGKIENLDDLGADAKAVLDSCADVLREVAQELSQSSGDIRDLELALGGLVAARARLEGSAVHSLHRYEPEESARIDAHDAQLVSSLDQSFRADALAGTVVKLAEDALALVVARGRTWWQQFLGLEAKGSDSRLHAASRRLRSHLSPKSIWLHNSARGAVGLALSVLVAYQFGVQHAFWVVFGTLAVLRSNALSTGQTVLRALAGTIEGIIIGSIIIALLGSHETVFWILLPFAICFTGFAPSAISFAAGQAGFTMTILILFNIVDPIGWKLGVIRIEDVALGCAVSLVVGLLLWPRGASALLRRSVSGAMDAAVTYLAATVAYGLSRCDPDLRADVADPQRDRDAAPAAARRLDDSFREYLSERGVKSLSLADVSILIAAVTAIRTTADSIRELWGTHRRKGPANREAALSSIVSETDSIVRWFGDLQSALT